MTAESFDSSWIPNREEWLKQYNDTGYLVVENAIDPVTLQRLQSKLDKIEQEYVDGTLDATLKRYITDDTTRARTVGAGEGGNSISGIMELPLFDLVFRDIIVYPRVLDVLETIFDTSEFSFHNYKAICKMPHNNTPFQWHRDLPYVRHTSPNILTCMLCVDAMTVENGATVVCPGTHRIADEDIKDTDRNMPESEVPDNRVTVECPAGSAVLFHASIIHGGGPNLSDTKRRNIIGIWCGPDSLPVTPSRYAYEFLMPRSKDALRQKQIEMIFDRNSA
jgi:ectoine hydroxylase-related dioxygenase (phytanoyl-CoA dioxygenase family)